MTAEYDERLRPTPETPRLELTRSGEIQFYTGLAFGFCLLHLDGDILAQRRENPENTLVRESGKLPPHQLRYIRLCQPPLLSRPEIE
jgi:hypothetical protein